MQVEASRIKSPENEPGLACLPGLSGIELQCPRCKIGTASWECSHCGFHIRNLNGILHALPPERVVYHARFVEVYERAKRAAFRGSRSDEFFLGLPYSDASRLNASHWARRASSFDCIMRRVLKPWVQVGGRILDLGAGNCWLSYRLALAGYNPCAVDLITNDHDGLSAAEHYRKYLPDFFPRFRAEFDHLPFKDCQFDAAIFNASFHYAENLETTLREVLRCCKQHGIVIICDTPWFSSGESGNMLPGQGFVQPIGSIETTSEFRSGSKFLTDVHLNNLENQLQIRWMIHSPNPGIRARIEQLIAQLRRRPEIPRFRVFVARRSSR